jgi:hypothetical protein
MHALSPRDGLGAHFGESDVAHVPDSCNGASVLVG